MNKKRQNNKRKLKKIVVKKLILILKQRGIETKSLGWPDAIDILVREDNLQPPLKNTPGHKFRWLLNYFKEDLEEEKSNNFYNSEQWVGLKTKVLKHYGRTCMKCNAKNVEMHVDHIKPRSKYPKLELDVGNLQVLCKSCNKAKSNKNEIDYRPKNMIALKLSDLKDNRRFFGY